jgi:hypothetical protein
LKTKLLVFARDAGPAAALAGVVRAAHGRGYAVVVAGVGPGQLAFERDGLPVEAIDAPNPLAVETAFEALGIQGVITGTSLDVAGDALFWEAAAARDLPCIALLDHWRAYEHRFTVHRLHDTLPPRLAVMDPQSASRLSDSGFPVGRISVTGQPYFDRTRKSIDVPNRSRARLELGVDPDRRVLVFVSEASRPVVGDGSRADPRTLSSLPHALRRVTSHLANEMPDALVIVKTHPREQATYGQIPELESGVELRWIRGYRPWRLLSAADTVVGSASIMLLQAWALGIPAFSLVDDDEQDHFSEVHAARIHIGSLESALERLGDALRNGPNRAPESIPFGEGAIDSVLDLVAIELRS